MRLPTTLPEAYPAYVLRAATGSVEYAIARALAQSASRPRKVTRLLAAMFATIGGEPASQDRVGRLSAGSREWLVQRAAAVFHRGEIWYESRCSRCDAPYDLSCDLDALPMKQPGEGFPMIVVSTSKGDCAFEVPNGMHEEVLAASGLQGESARRRLLELVALDEAAAELARRAPIEELDRVDLALEEVAAESAAEAICACPSCGKQTSACIDPLLFAFPRVADLLHDIHVIASAYHWRQGEILELGSGLRRTYLELIRTDRRWVAA
jgi:hypothetical protein